MQASRIRIVLVAAGLLAAAPLFANECDGTNALSDSHLAAGAGGAADVDGAGTSAGEGPAGAGTSTGESRRRWWYADAVRCFQRRHGQRDS